MKAYINTLIYEVKFKGTKDEFGWANIAFATSGTTYGIHGIDQIIYLITMSEGFNIYELDSDIDTPAQRLMLNKLFEYTGRIFTLKEFNENYLLNIGDEIEEGTQLL